jgi:hypothetical protein
MEQCVLVCCLVMSFLPMCMFATLFSSGHEKQIKAGRGTQVHACVRGLIRV